MITRSETLSYLLDEAKKMPGIYRPSPFWDSINEIHRKQIADIGIENFKRSVNFKYFNWRTLGIMRHQTAPILKQLFKGNFNPLLKSEFVNPKLAGIKNIYRVYVASLFELVKKDDHLKLFEKIEEPALGNPLLIRYGNGLRTQDLCNSIHEFYSVFDYADFGKKINAAEIGAGYGRTAYVFLKAMPESSYCIIDIPPALYVSQQYLSKVFAGEKIFTYRPFDSFETIEKEFMAARIKFLMPNQIELLPARIFDLIITVSSLHEMTRTNIKFYKTNWQIILRIFLYQTMAKIARKRQ